MKERLKSLFLKVQKHWQTKQGMPVLAVIYTLGGIMPAMADIPHNTILPSDELDLSTPCVETHLKINPQLKNGIIVKATRGTAPDMMQGRDGAQTRLSLRYGSCTPGASLWLDLSPNITLSIHDSSEATFIEEGKLTALEANLQDATLTADTIESLDLAANGASQATIHRLDRAAQIAAVASSQVTVDEVNLTALSATMGGTSSLKVTSGLVSVVTLFLTQQSTAEIHASIGKAGVTAHDQSKAKVGPLLGALLPRGTGTIETFEETAPKPAPKPKPVAPPTPTPEEQKAAAIAAETAAFLKNPGASVPPQSTSPQSSPQETQPQSPATLPEQPEASPETTTTPSEPAMPQQATEPQPSPAPLQETQETPPASTPSGAAQPKTASPPEATQASTPTSTDNEETPDKQPASPDQQEPPPAPASSEAARPETASPLEVAPAATSTSTDVAKTPDKQPTSPDQKDQPSASSDATATLETPTGPLKPLP